MTSEPGNAVLHGRDLEQDLELDADVVIVGSGASGAVVACVLAEAGQNVVLLEDGPHVTPEVYGAMRPSESMRTLWRDGGTTFAFGIGESPMINVTMGRCVGGSSVLTGGICYRTPEFVLDEWATKHRLHELAPSRMEACFDAVEEEVFVETVPLHMRSLSTVKFGDGAAKLGYPLKSMRRNTRGCNGCGRCNFGCPHGAKMSVDQAFLPRALAAGARILSDVRVRKITTRGDRATGVLARARNGEGLREASNVVVRSKRVVVTTGAYSSPALLATAGIGRQSGQLGRNLTLHPSFRIMARFDDLLEGWKGALQSAYSDHFEHERILFNSVFVPPGVICGALPGVGPEYAKSSRQLPHLAMFGGMIHDDGGGRIHDFFGRTFATYRMSRVDRSLVPRILRIAAETFFAAGAREVFLPVLGMAPVRDMDHLRSLDLERVPPRQIECSSQHPLGTARMGVMPEHSVVDPNGKTWELDELYVADGSISPTSLGVNPQETIMAMAMRIAWKLRETPFAA